MKLLLFVIAFFAIGYTTAQVGIGTTTPNSSALLDVTSNTKGVLVPRMTKSEKNAIATPAQGLLVFQNAPDSIGFYYYDGTQWVYLLPSASLQNAWLISGNANTDTSIHFLGTTDNQGLKFKTNNEWAGFLNNNSGKVYFGQNSGSKETNQTHNVAIGTNAMEWGNLGGNQIAIGNNALRGSNLTTTTTENIAIGTNSLFTNRTGSFNIAIGRESLRNNDTSKYNIAIGVGSLCNNVKNNTIAIGDSALANNGVGAITTTHGTGNIAIGSYALSRNNQGYHHTAVGHNALRRITNTSNSNTAIGFSSLANLGNSASNNTAVGAEAGFSLANSAQSNVAIGSDALRNGTNPNGVTAVGYAALREQSTSGQGVTAIGKFAGYSYSNGDSCTFIGAGADATVTNLRNATAVGANTKVSQNNTLILGNNANVGIGTSTPAASLDVAGSFKLGTNGTALNNILKTSFIYDCPSIAANDTEAQNFTIPNLNIGATVMVTPQGALPDGVVIQASIFAAGTLTLKFINASNNTRNPASLTYHVTIIQ